MGYRSQVRIVLKKENYNELVEKFKKEISKDNYMFDIKRYDFNYSERDNGNIVLFGWDDIKWYHEYNDIQCVENYLNELYNKNIPFKIVIVGEDGASEENFSDCIMEDEEYEEKFNIIQAVSYIDILEE